MCVYIIKKCRCCVVWHNLHHHFIKKKKFPFPFSGMLSMMSILSFDFLYIECLGFGDNAYYTSVYVWSIVPIAIALLIALIGVIRTVPLTSHTSKIKVYSTHVWLVLLLSYIVLPPVSNKQLGVFDCITLKSGKRYLRSNTSVDCDSQDYEAFSTHVILFVILYQIIPIVWITLLFRKRHVLNPPTFEEDQRLAVYIRSKSEDLFPLKFLFEDYKCNKWWFEVVDMYRRITFIGVLPLLSPDSAVRASFGMLLAMASVAYFREEKPYCEAFTNVIARIAQVIKKMTI
jgi:hypothetical protein